MRVVSFNQGSVGAVHDGTITDLTAMITGPARRGRPTAGMIGLIERWDTLRRTLVAGELAALPAIPLANARLDAPVSAPGKIIAAPVNYLDHQTEMKADATVADLGFFLKAPTSVIGPGGTVQLPYLDRRTDQEGELAVVIGATARHITPEQALGHVFGYTCLLDITVRGREDRSMRKSFDTFTPIGPWITTADEVGDPGSLELRCWVNGELRQNATTKDLIVGAADLIAHISSVLTLYPGDIIATGTPAGVGPLAHGDRVAVEIERVGRLEVSVSAEGAAAWEDRRLRR